MSRVDSTLIAHNPCGWRGCGVKLLEILRRRHVAFTLLVAIMVLSGAVYQRLCHSLDEINQISVARHSMSYIASHDPQNMPFYVSAIHSDYFGSRYLVSLIPAAAELAAAGLPGYWRGKSNHGQRPPVLPWPATWAIGFALGVLAANAKIAYAIPVGAVADGLEIGHFHRGLARWFGDPAAGALLAVGVAGLVLRGRIGPRMGLGVKPGGISSASIWSVLLIASMPGLILGPSFSKPFHELPAVLSAAVLLAACEHLASDRYLHALRYGFLAVVAVAAWWWRATVAAVPLVTAPFILLGVAAHIPTILIVVPLARETGPTLSSNDGT